jgi:hypothetical protein
MIFAFCFSHALGTFDFMWAPPGVGKEKEMELDERLIFDDMHGKEELRKMIFGQAVHAGGPE